MLVKVEAWPEEDREELAEFAREIEARRHGRCFASAEELKGIDRGLEAARLGKFAGEIPSGTRILRTGPARSGRAFA